jgi:hypothetical protein
MVMSGILLIFRLTTNLKIAGELGFNDCMDTFQRYVTAK